MTKLVECVPNFSEGRDLLLVQDIVSSIKTAKVLNVHSDADHNRSVVTILGTPKDVRQAAYDLTERAMQLLDVNSHEGEHPFIGIMDVIPFIPICGVEMDEIVRLAHGLGHDLWHKLNLPVYFYDYAAKMKERDELPLVRKGGYELLQEEIQNPHRKPDVGNALHKTGGAVAVGVRDFLIAYNINLDTTDLDIARSIASNIREKNSGLHGIRALGIDLKSKECCQVSINVVDHKRTTLKMVFDEVSKWAKEYQVNILDSEIVGLLPKSAVFTDMKDYLKQTKMFSACIHFTG